MIKFMKQIRGFCPDGNTMLYGNPTRAYGIFNGDFSLETCHFVYMVDGKGVIRFRLVDHVVDYSIKGVSRLISVFTREEQFEFLRLLSADITKLKGN